MTLICYRNTIIGKYFLVYVNVVRFVGYVVFERENW